MAQLPAMVVALHPKCPCSRATLETISRLLVTSKDGISISILLFVPSGHPEWNSSIIAMQAREIPGLRVYEDGNGAEAERFGLSVSGQAAIFSRSGGRIYAGGLTPSRGHQGESAGTLAVRAAVTGQLPRFPLGKVFGCTIPRARAEL